MVDVVELDFVEHLEGIVERFGNVGEHLLHLGCGFQPLLLGVEHTVFVGDFLVGSHADEAFVSLGVVLVDEVHIVGGHKLDAEFLRHTYQLLVHLLLQGVGVVVGALHGGFMALQLQIVVVAEYLLKPHHGLLGAFDVAGGDEFGNFAAQAGRTANQPFGVSLYVVVVGAGAEIETVGPCS